MRIETDIKFKNVAFSYDKNKIILNNINIDIEGGKINAIVGLSGVIVQLTTTKIFMTLFYMSFQQALTVSVIAAATSFVADKAASNFDSPICICR